MPAGVTLTLQVDLSGTTFGGTPTWTDITSWWMSSSVDPGGGPVSIPWGRQDQSSVVEASTTSFTLNNADGRFTPGRSTLVTGGANPYYPHVRRHVRMRLTATGGATTVVLVDGLVDAWVVTPQIDGPTLATAELTDIYGRVSASTALRALYDEEVLLDTPQAYYLLTEDAGAQSFGDITNHNPVAVAVQSKYGASAFAAGAALPSNVGFASSTGVAFTNSVTITGPQTVLSAQGALMSTAAPFTFEVWMSTTMSTANSGGLIVAARSDGVSTALMTSGNSVSFGSFQVVKAVNDGALHHLVGVWDGTSTTIYVDGVGSSAGTTISGLPVATVYIGGSLVYGISAIAGFTGTIARAAIYTTALSPARVTAHYNAGLSNFAGESTSDRWARLLTYRTTQGGTTTGTVGTVGSRDLAGMSLGDAFTDTATAEGGVIETHRGTLTLIGRSGVRNPTTTVTLNAANGEVDIPTTWRDDTQGFVNDATVTRADGATQRVTSAASIAADGVSQASVDANVNTDRDAADMAGWLVAVGTQDELTSPTLTVNLYARNNATLTLGVCALRTFDIVTMTNLPAAAPASTMSLQAQGGQLTVGADTFTATINTTAVPPTTLRADATADAYTKLDNGLVFGW